MVLEPPDSRLSPTRSSTPLAWLVCLALVVIATTHAFVAVRAMAGKSTTADELAHVTGGYNFNRWNDYRLHPENGNLPQRLHALPAVLGGATWPGFDGPAWRGSDVWGLGHAFFYELGNDPRQLLAGARAMNALFGVAVLLLVGGWAWKLFGPAGALVAAVFGAACPTMLAHTALATSDMAMSFFFLAATSAWWWHLHDPRPRVLLLSAVTFGLACVAKYSAVLLLPIYGGLALAAWLFARNTPGVRPRLLLRSAAVHAVVSIFVIWAFFGFRYSAFNPALPAGEFNLGWDYVLSFGAWKASVVRFFRDWHLLPEGWLYGLMFVLKHAEARGAFLDGEYSIFGWVSFFPKAFLYKTPPALLVALAMVAVATGLWVREQGRQAFANALHRTLPLTVLFTVYWVFSLTSNLNIGHRHILPTYPVLYIATGALGWMVVRSWRRARTGGVTTAALVAGLAGWLVVGTSAAHPHYLAYFSPLAGGPSQGYRRLVDSSLDWGQDLPGLKTWLDQHRQPGEKVFLSYFGTGEPAYYGIEAVALPRLHDFHTRRPWHRLEPGLYAISATMLQHVYSPIRGPWTLTQEKRFQELRAQEPAMLELPGPLDPAGPKIEGVDPAQWNYSWDLYEQLRFARLCHYLRARRPDAMIGYSILVFRLDRTAIDAAVHGSVRDLTDAIEREIQAAGAHR
jgi:hypothetical protein